MDRKPLPDNRIRRVMDAGLPGLEDDPRFEERVLQRIKSSEGKRKLPGGLAIALALVLMTASAVAISLSHRVGSDHQVIVTTGGTETTDVPDTDEDTGDTPMVPSTLAGCGHANAATEWVRRYIPIGAEGHKLVDTYYSMCYTCGEVFWSIDETLLQEAHDETMAIYEPGAWIPGRDPYTCKFCYARWYAQEP